MIQDRHVPVLVSLNSISGTVAPVIEDLRQVGTIPDMGNGPSTAVLIDLKLQDTNTVIPRTRTMHTYVHHL